MEIQWQIIPLWAVLVLSFGTNELSRHSFVNYSVIGHFVSNQAQIAVFDLVRFSSRLSLLLDEKSVSLVDHGVCCFLLLLLLFLWLWWILVWKMWQSEHTQRIWHITRMTALFIKQDSNRQKKWIEYLVQNNDIVTVMCSCTLQAMTKITDVTPGCVVGAAPPVT